MLREREKQVLAKLKGIAFTDSVHSVSSYDPPGIIFYLYFYTNYLKATRKFIVNHAVNWMQSDLPLDTPMPQSGESCVCVSAGHEKHVNINFYVY